jgi:hypothetical protein
VSIEEWVANEYDTRKALAMLARELDKERERSRRAEQCLVQLLGSLCWGRPEDAKRLLAFERALNPPPPEPTDEERARREIAKVVRQGCESIIASTKAGARLLDIGVANGWLEPGELVESDSQSSFLRCRITYAGRQMAYEVQP